MIHIKKNKKKSLKQNQNLNYSMVWQEASLSAALVIQENFCFPLEILAGKQFRIPTICTATAESAQASPSLSFAQITVVLWRTRFCHHSRSYLESSELGRQVPWLRKLVLNSSWRQFYE